MSNKMEMDILLEDMDEEKYRIRYTPFVKKPRLCLRDIPIYATSYDNERKKQARRRRFKFGNRRDQSKWVSDEHADIGDEDEDDEEEILKTHWSTTFQAKMASIALIFSTSNLIRFPFSCYNHGGIVFFLVYCFIVLIMIQPLIFFELLIGQFSMDGIKGFSKLDKYAHGLPYALVFICLIFSTYNNAVVGYNGIYAWSSYYTNPAKCDPLWNTLKGCVAYEKLMETDNFNESLRLTDQSITTSRLSTELFFREYVLDLDWTGAKLKGDFTWKFLSGLVLVFILAAVVVRGRFTSTVSKVLVCASLIVPLLVGALYFHQYFLQGANSGRTYFSHFRWEKLRNLELWSEAIRMAFTTSGVGFGLYTHIASRHNFYFDQLHSTSWLVCGCLMAFSALAALVVFTELGILGDILNSTNYYEIFSERSGISFICLSGSLHKLYFLPASFIFFICMNIFGIWGQIVSTDMCSRFVSQFMLKRYTNSQRLSRYTSLVGVIIVQLGFASLFGTEAGHIMLDSGHLYGGAWAAVVILLTEMFTAFLLYGYHVFIADIEIMIDYPLPSLFQLQMKYFMGPALCLTLALMTIHWFQTPLSYHNHNTIESKKSAWLYIFGICMNLVPVAVMIVCALHTVRKTFKVGHLDDTVEEDILSHLIRHQHAYNTGTKPATDKLHSLSRDCFHLNAQSVAKIGAMPKQEWEAHKWLRFHQKIKEKLIALQKYTRAKCRWEKATNIAILSYLNKNKKAIKSVYQLANLYVRENERQRDMVEMDYLTKLVQKASIENMIGHFDIIDKDHEEDILLDHLLRSTPLPESKFVTVLPQQNYYGEIYNKLIGRIPPSQEEQYEALISRVKQKLGITDTAILRSIRKRRYVTEQQIIMDKEDTPLEISVPLKVTIAPNKTVPQILNVIIVKGKTHSLLQKLPVPRPLVLKIPYAELSDLTLPQVHRHLISLASRYMASTVLKEVNPLPPNPKISDNLHRQVYDFLDPRCTCIIILEEEVKSWEHREDNWLLRRSNNKGIKQAVIPENVEMTLAQMIRKNTINAKKLSRGFLEPRHNIHKKVESSSSSSSRGDEMKICPDDRKSFSCVNAEDAKELPRLIFWSEKVPPGNINALREARRYAKFMGQFGQTNMYKEDIKENQQGDLFDDDSEDDLSDESSESSNPSLTYMDDLQPISSDEALHGSINSRLNLIEFFDEAPISDPTTGPLGGQEPVPQLQSLFSLQRGWYHSANTNAKSAEHMMKHEEFGVHHFDSEHQYRKRKLDHVAHLERRLNNNRRDFIYYSAGKCLIVQMKRDNAFIYAESGDSIASSHEHED